MDSPSKSSEVKIISKCFIKPKTLNLEKLKEPYHLSPLDHVMLSLQYTQTGLFFLKPEIQPQDFMETLLQKLKDSFAATLDHFYPFAGRLSTSKSDNPTSYIVFVDCNNSPGAGFIHANSDLSVADIVGPKRTPLVIHSLFDHYKAVSHDGHFLSLLSVKVTELIDGVFIGLSMNHVLGDGSSFWHFFNSWSEIFNSDQENNGNNFSCQITNPPDLNRWFPKGYGPVYSLPFTNPTEFITRFEPPVLTERTFHFSSETIKSLKLKVNNKYGTAMNISSFQSLTGFIWKYITKARNLPYEEETRCSFAANNRSKMDPPLSLNYFGNCISSVRTMTVKSGELLENEFEWAALKVHQAVIGIKSQEIEAEIEEWLKNSFVYDLNTLSGLKIVHIGSSPRFKMYECEFGMGKAIAVKSSFSDKFDGKITAHPGRGGGGSIDLEICLAPQSLEALESDGEFMSLVSFSSSSSKS